MKGFFDTSVPVFYGDHIHHQASLQLFIQFDKSTGSCGAHSLPEVFSTLTRMPGKHRISGEQAMLFIGSLCERLSLIALDGEEYAKALGASASLGIVGGGIHDALLAHCAIKAQAETIYSWNGRHMRSADRKSFGVCKRPEGIRPHRAACHDMVPHPSPPGPFCAQRGAVRI
jgi:predicted nucleic acid-binding protein